MLAYAVSIELILIAAAVLLALSLFAGSASGRFGIPALLTFLVIGMLAGSEGPGGIYFDDPWMAQSLGVVALIFIIFAGGLDTNWQSIKPVLAKGIVLSTLGVVLTAAILGVCVKYIAGFTIKEAMLLGAIVSSTDVAAVFAILRSRSVSLKPHVKALLEFESGSNDPMAVFLTIAVITAITNEQSTAAGVALMFVQQMSVGAIAGFLAGKILIFSIKRANFEYEGLYSVLAIAAISLTYGLTSYSGGSGFLAVYVAGLVLGREDFVHKRVLMHFHDGIAWLMQIAMFLVLGLLVFPSQLISVTVAGLLISLALIFVARPLSVFISLAFLRSSLREKLLVSWVGLRGAAPIILATFPLLANVPQAQMMFNLVFFVVLTSTLIQGPLMPFVAGWLKQEVPVLKRPRSPIEVEPSEKMKSDLIDILIPRGAKIAGKQVKDLKMPEGNLIILINRDDKFFTPTGSTVLHEADMLLVLADKESIQKINTMVDEFGK